MSTFMEQGRTTPERGTTPKIEPIHNRSRALAGAQCHPSGKQDPNQSVQLTTQNASPARTQKGSGPLSGAMSQELFLTLRREADTSLQRLLGGVTNEVIQYLLDRQKLTPDAIFLEQGYILQWAARYWGAVRRAAVPYAAALAQAIGLKKGLGSKDLVWVRREIGAFYRQHIFGREPGGFLARSSAGLAEIRSPEETDAYFQRTLTRYGRTPLMMKPVRDKLAEAQELFGRTKKSGFESNAFQPTPVQKLANPEAFPQMDAKEVAALCGVSRSTVSRWVEEEKLERVGMGKKRGKRARLRIVTQSVKVFLEKYSE